MVVFQTEDQSPTAVSEEKQDVIVYDNSNIQKSCNGVTTPLTYHFTKRVYALVYRQAIKSLSISEKALLKNEDIFQNLTGLIKGRIYYNINNWYRGLQLFHSFKQNKVALAQMLGLTEALNFAEEDEQNWRLRLIRLWIKYIDRPRLLLKFASLKASVPKFLDRMADCTTEFYNKNFDHLTIKQLKLVKDDMDNNLIKYWTTPVINDLYILIACGALTKKLEKAGLANAEDLVNSFLSESQAVSNLQPAKHLHRLAIISASQPELRLLINRLPDDIHYQVKNRFNDFYQEVLYFIEHFGDRTSGELKLETDTMRTNPFLFYNYLRECLNAQISEIRASSQSQKASFKLFEPHLTHVTASKKEAIFSSVIKLQEAIAHREVFKLERSKVFGMYRTLYLAFGELFARNGWIENTNDIFYLTEDEILACENGKEYVYDTLIATRRQEFKLYEFEAVPSRVFVSTKVIDAIIKPNAVPVIQGFDSTEVKAEVA
ncbi:MAG: hypothetical protein H7Y13_00015 [Sphingobacteriaceae bacterium]|nr:hypothetical protein [Sphingobacteriaceae bacterium]